MINFGNMTTLELTYCGKYVVLVIWAMWTLLKYLNNVNISVS